MDSKPKLILVGMGDAGESALHLAMLKEKHGDNIILVTPEEAKEQGLTIEDLANVPTHKYTATPVIKTQNSDFKSGKENRRERRSKDRKKNRK